MAGAPPPKDPWPAPPPFYALYAANSPYGAPPEPPPIPPSDVKLLVFGLERQQKEQLVPDLRTEPLFATRPDGTVDFKAELRHLCQEILFLQLELLKTLSDNPAGYAAQLTLISKAFSNVQHLINCLRPYQARASLEYSLQQQLASCRSAISRLRTQRAAADEVLEGLAQALEEATTAAAANLQSALAGVQAEPREAAARGVEMDAGVGDAGAADEATAMES